ncbi:MAG: DNA methyltransferase [Vulcanimicrobiaceae bacterium]
MRVENIGNARLYLGDCREIIPSLALPAAVLTAPPYGIDFVHSGANVGGIGAGRYRTKFANEAIPGDDQPFDPSIVLRLQVPTILWGGNQYADRLPASPCWLIWDKRAASHHSNNFADCEIAWTNLDGVARVFRHHWDGMLRASERRQPRVHPMQKPVALMDWCLSFLDLEEGAEVLDPYMGSGTVGVAALRLGYRYVGIELNDRYFDAACERVYDVQRQYRLTL